MGADNIDAPPPADSPLPGSGKPPGGPDAGPRRDEGTPATDLDLRSIQDIEPVHRALPGEAPGDANTVATSDIGMPPADSPLASIGASPGEPDTGPHLDELTPATDSADSPAMATGPDLAAPAPAGDEGHALTYQTGDPADGSRSWWDKAEHGVKHGIVTAAALMNLGVSDVPPTVPLVGRAVISTAETVGTLSDAEDQGKQIGTEVSAVARGGELDPPGIGEAEHPVTEPDPEVPIDTAPDPAGPDDPDSPTADDVKTLLDREADREKEQAEADKAALGRRVPDRFPKVQNSPKISDQVRDRRPTPTGRGQSRGRPK